MIVVDVETGGLNPISNPLLSIGAIDFNEPRIRFYATCGARKDQIVTEEALSVNGFTQKDLDNTLTDKTILEQFFDWANNYTTGDFTIAGENPSFDRDFIAAGARTYNLKNPFGHRTVDLHSIAYSSLLKRVSGTPMNEHRKNLLNADVIYIYVGIPEEPRPHIASNGALWEAEAFSRLIKGKNMFEEFKNYPVII